MVNYTTEQKWEVRDLFLFSSRLLRHSQWLECGKRKISDAQLSTERPSNSQFCICQEKLDPNIHTNWKANQKVRINFACTHNSRHNLHHPPRWTDLILMQYLRSFYFKHVIFCELFFSLYPKCCLTLQPAKYFSWEKNGWEVRRDTSHGQILFPAGLSKCEHAAFSNS